MSRNNPLEWYEMNYLYWNCHRSSYALIHYTPNQIMGFAILQDLGNPYIKQRSTCTLS